MARPRKARPLAPTPKFTAGLSLSALAAGDGMPELPPRPRSGELGRVDLAGTGHQAQAAPGSCLAVLWMLASRMDPGDRVRVRLGSRPGRPDGRQRRHRAQGDRLGAGAIPAAAGGTRAPGEGRRVPGDAVAASTARANPALLRIWRTQPRRRAEPTPQERDARETFSRQAMARVQTAGVHQREEVTRRHDAPTTERGANDAE